MGDRRLVSIRRTVSADDRSRYDDAWARFRDAAAAAGAKAWRFRSEHDDGLHVEFLEYPTSADPRPIPEVAAAFGALHSIAVGTAEEWSDANTS